MGDEIPSFHYRALAELPDGQPIAETFTSNVEYLAGDELPLGSARWHVESVEQERIDEVNGHKQSVRTLRCVLK
jgi:hypothetical protein